MTHKTAGEIHRSLTKAQRRELADALEHSKPDIKMQTLATLKERRAVPVNSDARKVVMKKF